MNDQYNLEKHYEAQGYKNLGFVNLSSEACGAYQKSTNRQKHNVGRCLDLIALHDQKAYVMMDYGD